MDNVIAWPFGHGVVLTAIGTNKLAGSIIFAAIPDHLLDGDVGDSVDPSFMRQVLECGGPITSLQFKDEAAVDRLIKDLEGVKEELRAVEPVVGTLVFGEDLLD